MADINVSNLYQDPALTDVSLRWSNDQDTYICEQVFPVKYVQKRTGVYFKYNKENLRSNASLRNEFQRANRVDYQLSKVNYGPLLEHSLEIGLDFDTMSQYQTPLDPRIDGAVTVTEKIMLEKEVGIATDLANGSLVTQNVTLSGTSQWSDLGNSNPFTDLQTGISSVLQNSTKRPNTLVLSQYVWNVLKNHPDMLDRVKFSSLGVMTEPLLAELVGVDQVLIGRAVQNTVKEGQTDSLGYVWGKHAWLMYIAPGPSAIRTLTAGWHLTLNPGQNPADSVYKGIDRWVEQWTKSEFVRYTDYYIRAFVAAEAIYGVFNAVA